MWKSNRSVASLLERIGEHEKNYIENRRLEFEKELIFDELRKTKLWNYYPVRIRSWGSYSASILSLSLYDIPVEMVIDFFCGHLHRVFNINWRMVPSYDYVQLISYYKNIRITFEVNEESMQTCEIRRRIIKERSKDEMDMLRFEYAYEMDCAEED